MAFQAMPPMWRAEAADLDEGPGAKAAIHDERLDRRDSHTIS
jgi:hypothetical protein